MILLTGFGPFRDVADNPSGRVVPRVAKQLQRILAIPAEPRVLDVRSGVIEEQDLGRFQIVLSLGVDTKADAIRIEASARNAYSDARAGDPSPAAAPLTAIDPAHDLRHERLGGPLPPGITAAHPKFRVTLGDGSSAGTYVCNDTFYRACRGHRRAYFIHLPPAPPAEDAALAEALAGIGARVIRFTRDVLPA
jgi:pyrrolidone-carboxylate peptidase